MNMKEQYQAWRPFNLHMRPLENVRSSEDGVDYHYYAEPNSRSPDMQHIIAGAQRRAINNAFGDGTVETSPLTIDGGIYRCVLMPEGTRPLKKEGALSPDELEILKLTMLYIPETAEAHPALDAKGVYEKALKDAREINSVRLTGVTKAAEPVFLTEEQAQFEARLMLLKARMEVEDSIEQAKNKR